MLPERRKLHENRPPEDAKPARGGSKMACEGPVDGFSVPVGPNLAAKVARNVFGRLWGRSWDASGALGAVLGPFGLLLGLPGPLLGASWGSFWACQEADLDDLDDVCGAT